MQVEITKDIIWHKNRHKMAHCTVQTKGANSLKYLNINF